MADETTVAEAGTAEGVPAKRPRLEESGAQKVPTVLRKDLFDPEQAAVLRESVSGTMCVDSSLQARYFMLLLLPMLVYNTP